MEDLPISAADIRRKYKGGQNDTQYKRKVEGFLFDDHTWTIRYMVADTGTWLVNNQILISTVSIGRPDWNKKILPVNLTKEQVEKSPKIDTDKPVSRQHEIDLAAYYNWPSYWTGVMEPSVGSIQPYPVFASNTIKQEVAKLEKKEEQGDPNLRSTNEVIGYNIQANDGDIGHVEDFLAEDENWIIRYLVADTHNWLPGGKKVILSLNWIKEILWPNLHVKIDLSKEEIKNSPEYDPSTPTDRKYEDALHEHYNKPKYWDEQQRNN
ncbi:MAG: hypothetical protein P8Z35_06725 [Ignavibacteriaceae bacterium]